MPRTTCPKCGAVLELTADMVNQQIECGACQAVFVAKADAPASRRGEDRPSRRSDEDERPSRRRADDEDDRKSRRRADDEDDDRPSRRRRFEADEDEDDRPRRRRRRAGESGSQGLAITSLCLGVASIFLALLGLICCVGFLSIPVSIAGIICGIIGMKQNKGMAIGGIAAGGVSLLIYLLVVIFAGAVMALNPGFNKQNNGPPFGPPPQKQRFGR
jgi:hypothetical protein